MGFVAIACAIILVILIPRDIWLALLYVGLIFLVATVGLVAATLWIIG